MKDLISKTIWDVSLSPRHLSVSSSSRSSLVSTIDLAQMSSIGISLSTTEPFHAFRVPSSPTCTTISEKRMSITHATSSGGILISSSVVHFCSVTTVVSRLLSEVTVVDSLPISTGYTSTNL